MVQDYFLPLPRFVSGFWVDDAEIALSLAMRLSRLKLN